MPDPDKRKAAVARARARRRDRKDSPPRKCEDCGTEIKVEDAVHDPVRCNACLKVHNETVLGRQWKGDAA